MRQVRNHRFEPLHIEIANRIRRYLVHCFGFEDSVPVRSTVIQDDTSEGA
jgi:hypothetical protein